MPFKPILKLAMSLDEAARILGVSPNASADEVTRAYRQKVMENHPDRGGDNAQMVAINIAKEVLEGKRSTPSSYSDEPVRSEPRQPPPPPIEVTFEEAMSQAGVPSGVDWKLVGAPSFGGYGDTSIAACVVYGQKGHEHIFVSLYHIKSDNAFTRAKRDEWMISVDTDSLSKPMDRVLPVMFKALYSKFEGVRKGFSGKVALAGELTKLTQAIMWFKGRDMALKDAISQLGGATAPQSGEKLTVVMQLVSRGNDFPREEGIVFIINGREYPLEKASNEFVIKKTKILPVIFGNYYYFDSSKKDLTRAKKGKSVLKFLAEKLTGEPQSLKDLLMTASDQMKA